MPGQAPPKRHFQNHVFQYLPRVILNSLMSVAVTVLERRIRKALRSKARSGRPRWGGPIGSRVGAGAQ